MKLLNKYSIIFIVIVIYSTPCIAQEFTFKGVSNRMTVAVDMLASRYQKNEFEQMLRAYDYKYLGYVVDKSMSSKKIILSANPDISNEFVVSLHYDVSAYEDFLNSADKLKKQKNRLIPWSIYNRLGHASRDLELKAIVLNKTGKDHVEVTVNTVDDDGKEVPNCFVCYTPYLKDDNDHLTKFDNKSTPTTDKIPPGKWYIWTEKGDKKGPKSPFSCGDDGRDKRNIDLLAPK